MNINIWCDGSCDNKYKDLGCGVGAVLKSSSKTLHYAKYFPNRQTNNTAEMLAIETALLQVIAKNSTINLYSDSRFSINSLNGKYENTPEYQLMIVRIMSIIQNKDLNVEFYHLSETPSNEIAICHLLANNARKNKTDFRQYL